MPTPMARAKWKPLVCAVKRVRVRIRVRVRVRVTNPNPSPKRNLRGEQEEDPREGADELDVFPHGGDQVALEPQLQEERHDREEAELHDAEGRLVRVHGVDVRVAARAVGRRAPRGLECGERSGQLAVEPDARIVLAQLVALEPPRRATWLGLG